VGSVQEDKKESPLEYTALRRRSEGGKKNLLGGRGTFFRTTRPLNGKKISDPGTPKREKEAWVKGGVQSLYV